MVDDDLGSKMLNLIEDLKVAKPGDRSEIDRRFAIIITEMEKVYAYFNTYVVASPVPKE